jgi:4-hydroxythreonine-4-phosphate dehydrogenase
MKAKACRLILTPGEPKGIGPEITVKIFSKRFSELPPEVEILCIGAKEPFEEMGTPIEEFKEEDLEDGFSSLKEPRKIAFLAAPSQLPKSFPDGLLEGYQSGWAIEKASQLIEKGLFDGLVTGPISKERLQKGGFPYNGHTDFLAALWGKKEVTMMLANQFLRVSLVTVHIGLREVSTALSEDKIHRCLKDTIEGLQRGWGLKRPKVAVTALNPHAGENGLFGSEEKEIIEPAIQKAVSLWQNDAEITGPYPADTLFAKHQMASGSDRFDAIICMYHDQGLIPVKLLDFPKTVNVSLGLPWIRTSVDHGVGFDIAGKNVADESSLLSAIQTAYQWCMNEKSR